jgi:hypothetical protein
MVVQQSNPGKPTSTTRSSQDGGTNGRYHVRLGRTQADIVVPGAWLTFLVALAFFARPALVGGAVTSSLVLGIYYAARDAAGHD